MARIIAITNNKGGVGKTMTSLNLSAALSMLGKKVLMVDGDGQCNLTMQAAQSVPDNIHTLHDYLNDDDIKIEPFKVKENLFLMPGSSRLDEDAHNIELSIEDDENAAVHYLSDILRRVTKNYDFIIIDSAPGSGAMLVNIIVAASEMIVPIADKYSIPGAKKLTQIIRANHKKITGHYLLTRQTNFGVSKQIRETLTAQSPEALFHTYIRQCEDLNKASALSSDIFEFAPRSHGAEDYMALAKEIIGGHKDNDMPFYKVFLFIKYKTIVFNK